METTFLSYKKAGNPRGLVQSVFTCSKSTMETREQCVNTKMTSLTSFWCFHC